MQQQPNTVAAWCSLGLRGHIITLESRPDRTALAEAAAEQLGLPYVLHRVPPHPSSGAQGCFESHVQLAREGARAGERARLFLEDDFVVSKDLLEGHPGALAALQEAVQFVTSRCPTTWDILFLGVVPAVWREVTSPVGRHIYRMRPAFCTHAYIMSASYMAKVAEWQFNVGNKRDAIDIRYYLDQPRAYAVHPQLLVQRPVAGDINHGPIKIPQPIIDAHLRLTSWYACHVGVPLRSFVLLALAVCVAAFLLLRTRSRGRRQSRLTAGAP